MNLTALSDGFGIVASGVDLAQPLSEAAWAELERAFFAGQVLPAPAEALAFGSGVPPSSLSGRERLNIGGPSGWGRQKKRIFLSIPFAKGMDRNREPR